MERYRKKKDKENISGTIRISSIFKVKKCLFDQTQHKPSSLMGGALGKVSLFTSNENAESIPSESGQPVTSESPATTRIQKGSFEDSPFSLFKIKKKKTVLQSKSSNCSSDSISCTISTTPTNNKTAIKQKEVSPKEIATYIQNSSYIKWAVQKSILNPDLIGDFSKPCALPIIMGRHPDLKTISPETMANLLHGFKTLKFSLIDCRYPYEFKAGHIQTAQNIYIKDEIVSLLLSQSKTNERIESKEVIIFYCEFSSERGPSMLRHLRNIDRDMNRDIYPFLYYPELYILEGGYKAFFSTYKELCEPQQYKTMLDKDNSEDLAFHKNECKSYVRRSKCSKRARTSTLF